MRATARPTSLWEHTASPMSHGGPCLIKMRACDSVEVAEHSLHGMEDSHNAAVRREESLRMRTNTRRARARPSCSRSRASALGVVVVRAVRRARRRATPARSPSSVALLVLTLLGAAPRSSPSRWRSGAGSRGVARAPSWRRCYPRRRARARRRGRTPSRSSALSLAVPALVVLVLLVLAARRAARDARDEASA